MFGRSVDHAFDMGNTSQLSLYRLSLYCIRDIWKGLEHTMYWWCHVASEADIYYIWVFPKIGEPPNHPFQ